jgi:lysyl-tRNA synthetase class 2
MNTAWKTQCSLVTLRQRAFLMSEIRKFFSDKGVLEVETPILSSAGNTEVNIESFSSQKITLDANCSYLRTSPEFALKRLLSSGVGDVFELGKVFRKGEYSKTHNVEFTMLEWYRVGFKYNDLIQEVSALFKCLFNKFDKEIIGVEIKTFKQCFLEFLNIPINEFSVPELNKKCQSFDYDGSELSRDECYDYLFSTQIQPKLDQNKLVFVTHYPSSQAALAQIDPSDNSVCLRFEVFYNGIELGNGYQELTDFEILRKRFKQDNLIRLQQDKDTVIFDQNLLSAMEAGLPNCSGIAIGVDRLLMLLVEVNTIQQVISFNSTNA